NPEPYQDGDRRQNDAHLEDGDTEGIVPVLVVFVLAFVFEAAGLLLDLALVVIIAGDLLLETLQHRLDLLALVLAESGDDFTTHFVKMALGTLGLVIGPLIARLGLGQDRFIGSMAREER